MSKEGDDDSGYWAKRAFDRADNATEKQVEQTNQASVLALRSILILNGGACLALLSFLANTIKGTCLLGLRLSSLMRRSPSLLSPGALSSRFSQRRLRT